MKRTLVLLSISVLLVGSLSGETIENPEPELVYGEWELIEANENGVPIYMFGFVQLKRMLVQSDAVTWYHDFDDNNRFTEDEVEVEVSDALFTGRELTLIREGDEEYLEIRRIDELRNRYYFKYIRIE